MGSSLNRGFFHGVLQQCEEEGVITGYSQIAIFGHRDVNKHLCAALWLKK